MIRLPSLLLVRFGWVARDSSAFRYIFRHYGSCSDDCAGTDTNAWQNDSSCTDKSVVANSYFASDSRARRDVNTVADHAVMID